MDRSHPEDRRKARCTSGTGSENLGDEGLGPRRIDPQEFPPDPGAGDRGIQDPFRPAPAAFPAIVPAFPSRDGASGNHRAFESRAHLAHRCGRKCGTHPRETRGRQARELHAGGRAGLGIGEVADQAFGVAGRNLLPGRDPNRQIGRGRRCLHRPDRRRGDRLGGHPGRCRGRARLGDTASQRQEEDRPRRRPHDSAGPPRPGTSRVQIPQTSRAVGRARSCPLSTPHSRASPVASMARSPSRVGTVARSRQCRR